MRNAGILFQVLVLLVVANPVAAASVGGEVKPLKILTLGKESQGCRSVVRDLVLTYLKTEEVCKDWQRC